MGEFFGTDGIRGVAGQYPLDAATLERIGYSLARHLGEQHTGQPPLILIGRDTRESGNWIEAAIVRGIVTAQGRARSAGVITTPGVAYLTRLLKADAGVVISASHNPFEDNGIKVVTDLKSFLYLFNTTLEFSGGLNGKGFSFNNPNASRTCGCGESFAV